jgi:GTPase SAR1 family protein
MIADRYRQVRSELETALAGLLKLGSEMRQPASKLDTIQALLTDIREPLLFVAVGEVNSGKSSLLNALFGQEFAKVDVLPATDRVYIFRYGSEEKSVESSPEVTERFLPIPFLRDFNVVDTPGTNTMVAEHRMITEDFVPRADLVLFVFSVVNPWTQSSWDFLNFAQKKWLKNVVFVLQQTDLREPAEIDIIRRHLQDTAMRKLGFVPPLFAVSARKALLARTSGLDKERLWQESEFGALEEQINFIVSESSNRMLKLRSTAETARIMLEEFTSDLRKTMETLAHDEVRLAQVNSLCQTRKEQTLRQIPAVMREIAQAYGETVEAGTKLFGQKSDVWRIGKLVWSRKLKDFQAQLEENFNRSQQPKIEHALGELETGLRGVWPQLDDALGAPANSELRKQLPRAIPDFTRTRRDLVQTIRQRLMEALSGKGAEQHLARISRQTFLLLATAAVIIVAGVVTAAMVANSQRTLAIVSGIVAAVAGTFGVIILLAQSKRMIRVYQNQLNTSELTKKAEQNVHDAIDRFYKEITATFQPLSDFCATRRQTYEPLARRSEELEKLVTGFRSRL